LDCLEALFAALGAFGGALHEFRAYQFQLGEFGAIAFAPTQAHNTGVTAIALPEPGTKLLEQLLDRNGRPEESRSLAARMQRICLGERDHLIH